VINKKDLENRKFILGAIVVIVSVVFISKLFYLQIIDHSARLNADNNVIRNEVVFPSRGKIIDRNGKILVYNRAAYDLMIVPRKVKPFDTTLLSKALDIEKTELVRSIKKARSYSMYRPSIIASQLSPIEYAYLQEVLYRFPGFYIQQRTIRAYNYPNAALTLGYVGEVNQKNIDEDDYYKSGDYIGTNGIEKTYENYLRGIKGQRLVMVDAFGREQGKYREGRFDKEAVSGKDIVLTIDIELQMYAEKLMQNKTGSVVCIEPSTGEILALVSMPGFDPNLMVGRKRSENFKALLNHPLKPLNNRAIQGTYSPGSTFKMVSGAIAIQEGAINLNTRYSCSGRSSLPIKCTHSHISPINVVSSIETSCNPFFYRAFVATVERKSMAEFKKAYAKWAEHVRSFGFGERLGIDLPFEQKGNIPTVEYYDRIYNGSWRPLTIRSLSIGQGEILVTPLQMANEAVIMANGGHFYTPHLIKHIGEEKLVPKEFVERKQTTINPSNYEYIRQGMHQVYSGDIGTGRYYKNREIEMGGKTGTIENPHGKDHSGFIGFAPYESPKIAVSVLIENAGFGSTYACPLATLLMEKYLTDSIPPYHKIHEERLYNTSFINTPDEE
jgi:penicillin-binding protein 2